MRVALVYRSFHVGGSLPRFHVELSRYLASRGHDTHVYAIGARTERELAPDCTFHDVPVSAIGEGLTADWRELLSFSRNVRRLLATERYDAVHVRTPSTWDGDVIHVSGVVRGEALAAGMSPMRSAASMVRHPSGLARRLLEGKALRNPRVERFHADAPIVRDHLVQLYGIAPERVTVVLPGVDLDGFHPADDTRAERAALGLPADGRFLVLFCGHDFERKGLDRAIEALAAMREPAELVVVGHSPAEEGYRRLAAERGVADRVHFMGARDDAQRFYRAADAFLLPTRMDIWGITVIEAMASGLPCVVSDGAGSAALVEEGVTGYVVPEPCAVSQLVDALDRLAGSAELRASLGEAGRRVALAQSWARHGELVEAELQHVAERRAAAARSPTG
jgi:UDP-glucose:(heptosyl)LPS alpha-1,3-glucosyltransferase